MDFGLTLWGAGDVSAFHHILMTAWRIILVLLGVNALIIVHEFGHFIVARWCGVRCEKFYIWFDAYNFRFFRFKWGDTEYGLGWVPLGGYVKMLGQDDDPGEIREETERAKLKPAESETAAEGAAEGSDTSDKDIYAPDSYLSKNVFQRMAIISAGVIMNVIFAVLCAACAFMLGFPEPTSRLGQVFPNCPAWCAGLLPGDKIVAIDGKSCSLFTDIKLAMLDRKPVELTIERNVGGNTETIKKTVTPTMSKGQMTPTIGIYPSPALLLPDTGLVYSAGLDPALNKSLSELTEQVQPGERLTAMNGITVNTPADYQNLSRKFLDQPIQYDFVQADREGNPVADAPIHSATLPPKSMAETGIRLRMGEITAVAEDSPAANAGIRVQKRNPDTGEVIEHGDLPVAVNNEPILDPVMFPYQVHKLAVQGNADLVLTVQRDGKNIDIPFSVSDTPGYTGETAFNGHLASQEIGISYQVLPLVAGTDSSVQFAEETSPIGLRINAIEVALTPPDPDTDPEAAAVYDALTELGKPIPSGGFVYEISGNPKDAVDKVLTWFTDYVNYLPDGTPLKFFVGSDTAGRTVLETAVSRNGSAYLIDRDMKFGLSETQIAKTENIALALKCGWDKTVDSMGAIFRQLKNIGRNVSAKAFGGPVMIADIAYQATGTKDGTFLLFLCLISANLAVVNILPIPVLDGGHLLFLLYELIFRKKPNETVQVVLSYIGLFLILGLMVWVLFLDIARLSGLM